MINLNSSALNIEVQAIQLKKQCLGWRCSVGLLPAVCGKPTLQFDEGDLQEPQTSSHSNKS